MNSVPQYNSFNQTQQTDMSWAQSFFSWLGSLPVYIQVMLCLVICIIALFYFLGKTGLGKDIISAFNARHEKEWEAQKQENEEQKKSRELITQMSVSFQEFKNYYQSEHEKLVDKVDLLKENLIKAKSESDSEDEMLHQKLSELVDTIKTIQQVSDERDSKIMGALNETNKTYESVSVVLLKDRITHYCIVSRNRGYRTRMGSQLCRACYEQYKKCGGNSYIDELVSEYNALPIKGEAIESPIYDTHS